MISCDTHDYIEIVCTYRYPIKLRLKSGAIIEGVSLDTAYDGNRKECIKLDVAGVETLVVLEDISLLEVCVANPHVRSVSFD